MVILEVEGSKVEIPTLDSEINTQVYFLKLASLVNLAYNAQAAFPTPSWDKKTGFPDEGIVPEVISYIQSQDSSLTNIVPTWIFEADAFELMGFAATVQAEAGTIPYFNVLVTRGTVTSNEASADLYGWEKNPVPISLPTPFPTAFPPNALSPRFQPISAPMTGSVNSSMQSWFQDGPEFYSLPWPFATSVEQAVNKVMKDDASAKLPWVFTAHSLGAPLTTLAAADCAQYGLIQAEATTVVTFGGMMFAQNDFSTAFKALFPDRSLRFTNICDFVPAIQALQPPSSPPGFEQIGPAATFAWQKGELWANHSMTNTYQAVLSQFWPLLNFNAVNYPITT